MKALHLIKLFALSYPLFIILDLFWVAYLMSETYHKHIGYMYHIINGQMQLNKTASFTAWALIVAGALLLVLPQAKGASVVTVFAWGALYGLVVYGFSNLNNLALFKGWPLSITLIDITWGMVLNGLFLILLHRIDKYIN